MVVVGDGGMGTIAPTQTFVGYSTVSTGVDDALHRNTANTGGSHLPRGYVGQCDIACGDSYLRIGSTTTLPNSFYGIDIIILNARNIRVTGVGCRSYLSVVSVYFIMMY